MSPPHRLTLRTLHPDATGFCIRMQASPQGSHGSAPPDRQPGPDFALVRPKHEEAQAELLEPPSVAERHLRHRVGELVATQAVEDEGEMQTRQRSAGGAGQHGLYHCYNAVLKRALVAKGERR